MPLSSKRSRSGCDPSLIEAVKATGATRLSAGSAWFVQSNPSRDGASRCYDTASEHQLAQDHDEYCRRQQLDKTIAEAGIEGRGNCSRQPRIEKTFATERQ